MCIRDRYQRRVRDTHRANMKFVVAYDGSEHAKEALLYALPYLAGNDVVVWVGFKPDWGALTSDGEVSQNVLEEHAKATRASSEATAMMDGEAIASRVSVVGIVRRGQTVGQAVVGCAREMGASCIVLGTRGMGEIKSKVYGSVAQSVLFENSQIPALIVHPGAAATRDKFGHSVLFALDGSDRSLRAVAHGGAFISEGCKVYMFHAHPQPQQYTVVATPGLRSNHVVLGNSTYEQECADMAEHHRELGREAQRRLWDAAAVELPAENFEFVRCNSASPSPGLQSWQAQRGADLVVVGSRGQTGLSRIWNGSLAHDLLHEPEGFALLVTHEAE
eukprot:TRINITY_DN8015_c0_g1_i11.p1 TRINITY_DN8015_c0_g1~~TRINITY_DN8015_c0_g1_i11.p1  ORF type:complete len:333 (+),score=68.39 TRINITY_DN8015_c0_g1_i11:129-1127(+)